MADGDRKQISLFVKLCSDKAAFEARPQRRVTFDMNRLQELFRTTEEYEITMHTPHIIFLKNRRGREITFSKDGRMLLRKVSNESEARKLACDVFNLALDACDGS